MYRFILTTRRTLSIQYFLRSGSMLYLYVELRYHRQLNKICPDIPVRFPLLATLSE